MRDRLTSYQTFKLKKDYFSRLQKDAQFKVYQGLHWEKKKLEEKPDTYPPNTCVLMGDSILNSVIERNLSNDPSVKIRKMPGATVYDLRHHALPIIRKQPKPLILQAGTNDVVKFSSRDISRSSLNLLFRKYNSEIRQR